MGKTRGPPGPSTRCHRCSRCRSFGRPVGSSPRLGSGCLRLVLPVLVLPDLAWGVAGRLKPVQYPSDWPAGGLPSTPAMRWFFHGSPFANSRGTAGGKRLIRCQDSLNRRLRRPRNLTCRRWRRGQRRRGAEISGGGRRPCDWATFDRDDATAGCLLGLWRNGLRPEMCRLLFSWGRLRWSMGQRCSCTASETSPGRVLRRMHRPWPSQTAPPSLSSWERACWPFAGRPAARHHFVFAHNRRDLARVQGHPRR